ncbi:NlpC/P60 family protein [Nocardiopsis sp. N85]|uniref:C40 family peptidase n=1 Tax=Nocardiopsis sp. N85 TaxID=3029400 RepID=UPI00237F8133|nr:C40 family peptidase [Nocardiopsis sp. N85]MDE3724244.1 NlpC/P60 family protein [Nocardiopsis sp. N85]
MKNTGGRRTARRIAASTGIGAVVAGSLLVPGTAYAEPTREEVEEEIERLNEEASTAVEEYNQAKEDHEVAEARYDELDEEVGAEQENYEALKEKVQKLANATYQSGDMDSVANLLTSNGPENLLEQTADLNYLSDSQKAQLDEFGESAERLFSLKDEAEEALEEAEDALEKSEEAKDEVEEKISEQEELLTQFPDADVSTEGANDSGGQSYTGSATGNAALALDFAYAQIGKPYIYGGTGPNGYDCSGLTQAAWRHGGVDLPRTTYSQAEVGTRIYDMNALQPGDIMFFSSLGHNGLYAGNGQMVHAPRTGRNIEVVGLAAYWAGQFQFAVRP